MTTSSSGNLNRYELETLYEIARTLHSTLDLAEVLLLVMDRVINVVRADRGFLMLVNAETNRLEFNIARNSQASDPFPLEVKNRTALPNVRRLQGLN